MRGVNYFCRSCCLRRECYQRTGAAIETGNVAGLIAILSCSFSFLSNTTGIGCGNVGISRERDFQVPVETVLWFPWGRHFHSRLCGSLTCTRHPVKMRRPADARRRAAIL